MINNMIQPMCYHYELYMDAVIELADGTDYHTPVTAHVYAIDGVEALKVWIAEAPDDLLMKHGLFVVSVRADHVHSARILWGRPNYPYVFD